MSKALLRPPTDPIRHQPFENAAVLECINIAETLTVALYEQEILQISVLTSQETGPVS